LANVDVLLGLRPKRNISDVLAGECKLTDVLLDVNENVRIVPASSGTQEMTSLGVHEHAELIYAFNELADDIDVLVIDTAAGISSSVVSFVRAAQEVLVVVCDEPTSITDAYALIKLLNRDYKMTRFRVLANMVANDTEGRNMFNKLITVTDRFLDVTLQYVGSIPYDENVRKSVQRQIPVLKAFSKTKAAIAYRQLANKVDAWPVMDVPRGHLEFFVERLVQGV
jgi:flagellar biosynthesis protein FlhG